MRIGAALHIQGSWTRSRQEAASMGGISGGRPILGLRVGARADNFASVGAACAIRATVRALSMPCAHG